MLDRRGGEEQRLADFEAAEDDRRGHSSKSFCAAGMSVLTLYSGGRREMAEHRAQQAHFALHELARRTRAGGRDWC